MSSDSTATSGDNFTWYSAPTITSFMPEVGGAGTVITVIGTNLTSTGTVHDVQIGGTSATAFTVVSGTSITATVGTCTTGKVKVFAIGGTATSGDDFTWYPAPTIISFTPEVGGAGTEITITGTNYTSAGTVNDVQIGGISVTSFTVASGTSITATVGTGTTGAVTVFADGGAANSDDTFTWFTEPTITSFTPEVGGNGTVILITGANFSSAGNVNDVQIGGTSASTFTVVSDTSITATVATGTTGTVTVLADGGSATSGDDFTWYPAATITSFTPTSGIAGTTVSITGANFTGTTAVSFGDLPADSYTIVSDTSLTATVGSGATGSIIITNAGGVTYSTGAFTVYSVPLAGDIGYSAVAGQTLMVDAPGVLNYAFNADGNPLSAIPIVDGTTDNGGTVNLDADGSFSYLPADGFWGQDTVSYSVTNDYGVASSPATVTITVYSVPVANADAYTVNAGSSLAVSADQGVLANDTNADGSLLTATLVSGPAFGLLELQPDGSFVYTPNTGFSGSTDCFSYFASDPMASSSPMVVTLTVISPLSAVTLTASPASPQPADTPITLTGAATGGANVQYQFMLFNPAASPAWSTLQDFSASSTCTWMPDTLGSYLLYLNAVDSTGSMATATLNYIISSSGPLTDVTLTVSPDSPQTLGASILLSAIPTGDVNVLYQFVAYDLDNPQPYSVPQDYSVLSTCTWTPTSADNYLLIVNAMDAVTGTLVSSIPQIYTIDSALMDGGFGFLTPIIGGITMGVGTTSSQLSAVTLSAAPLTGIETVGTTVTLTATATGGSMVHYQFWVNNANTNPPTSKLQDFSASSTCSWTPTSVGTYNITVIAQDSASLIGITVNNTIYTYRVEPAPPTISSFNPSNGGIGTSVSITGTNFARVTGASAVTIGGTNAASYTVNSPTSISATVGAGSSGTIQVVAAGGTATSGSSFTWFPAPTISSFSPTKSGVGSVVTITGTYFTGATAVAFGGTPAPTFNVSSDNTIYVLVGSVYNGNLTVTTPGGTATSATNFYLTPTIASFSPNFGVFYTAVTISGTNFCMPPKVYFNGKLVITMSWETPTSIIAHVPPGATKGPITVTLAGGGTATSTAQFYFPPTITSFNTNYGGAGTLVTISGANFTGATSVAFGGTAATSFSVVSDTSITATVGNGAVGKVTVTTPGGTAISTQTYYYLPSITSFSPASGKYYSIVTITGTGFNTSPAVYFNGAVATHIWVSSTEITATVPANATTGPITVNLSGNRTATSSANFYLTPVFNLAPNITSFTPTSAATRAVVTITGTNFTGAIAVVFGGTAAASFTVVSGTSITASVGGGASGTITVTTLYGTATSSENFTFIPAPTITSFTPSSGGNGTTVTINGTNLLGATADGVIFGDTGGTAATAVIVVSANQITATVGSGASGIISVTAYGGTVSSRSTFTWFQSPTISSFSPTSGIVGTVVTIIGTNFTGTTAVVFHGTAAASFTIGSTGSISATVGGVSSGTITVTNPAGTATSSGAFTFIPAPIITSFSPTSGATGTSVTIHGFHFTGTTRVAFGGTAATAVAIINVTQISATVCGGSTGRISLTNSGGTGTSSGTFTFYPTPTINSFKPTSGGLGTTVTIYGTNLSGATAVTFGGTAATFIVCSATSISAIVGNGTSGSITVTTPGGTASSWHYFCLPPTITSFTPTSGGAGTKVTITGINFFGTFAVAFNGKPATAFIVDNATTISAAVGSGMTGTITVTNSGGTATSTNFNWYHAPTISSFTPANGGQNTLVTINGTNLTDESLVTIGGTSATNVTLVSASRITATVSTGATGTITVTTYGGTVTSASTFTWYVPPTITSFTPTDGGNGTVVTINGTDLNGATAAEVLFGGMGGTAATAVTVVSATQINATVGIGTTGTISVTAYGGMVDSSAITPTNTFTWHDAPTITSFSPIYGGNRTVVTINGTNLLGATAVGVFFGGTAATAVTVMSATQITATVGTGSTGTISVTAYGGRADSSAVTPTNTFAWHNVPTITSFTPTSGWNGTNIFITGTNFYGVYGSSAVNIGGTAVSAYTVNSNTSIYATVGSGTTTGTIQVVAFGGTATSTGTFTVNSICASNFAFTVAKNQTLTIAAPLVVNSAYNPNNYTTLSAVPINQEITTLGNVTQSTDGSFSYISTGGLGQDAFTYQLTNGNGVYSETASVSITVYSVPVANADAYSVNAGSSLAVSADQGVLANDTNEDGAPLTAALVSDVSNGQLTLHPDGSFVYTPHPGFSGSADCFSYIASDPMASSTPAVVTLTVIPPLSSVTLTASKTSPQSVNTSITLTGSATDGTNVQYQFMLFNPAASQAWSVLRNFSSTATCNWTPGRPGVYLLFLTAQDAYGAIGTDSIWYTISDAVTLQVNHASPQPVHTPITLTGSVVGGSNVQYQFWVYNPTASSPWNTLPNATTATCTWTPNTPGTYLLSVSAEDNNGYIGDDSLCYTIQYPPLTAVSLSTSPTSPQTFYTTTPTTITLTASTTGGTSLTYQFWVYNPTTLPAWNLLQDFSTTSSCAWTPSSADNYLLVVNAIDNNSGTLVTSAPSMFTIDNGYTVSQTMSGLTLSPAQSSPISVNTPITLTASVTGGTNVTYQFCVYNPAAMPAWILLQNFSASATCTWTPSAPGNYLISATAQDGVYYTILNTTQWYAISQLPPLTAVSLSSTQNSPQSVNTPINLSATATGGTGVLYRFVAFDLDQNIPALSGAVLRDFSTTSTCTWTPTTADNFLLLVTAMDGVTGTPVTSPPILYTINNGTTPSLTAVSLTTTPSSPQQVNTAITLTATPSGGTGVSYRFLAFDQDIPIPSCTVLRDFSSTDSCVWTPTVSDNFLLLVTAKDSITGTQVTSTPIPYNIGTPLTTSSTLSVVTLDAALISPQPISTSIALTATPTGGSSVTYQFWVYNAGATPAWSQLQDYASTSHCSWTPTIAGNYLLFASAKDGDTDKIVNTTRNYTITQLVPLTAVALITTPSSPHPVNTNISLTAIATGGRDETYQFWSYNATSTPQWQLLQDFSATATCFWTPTVAGNYLITATAQDATTVVSTTLGYTITQASPLTTVSVTPSPASPQAPDTPITFTAVATGGTNLQYQFLIYNPNVPGWSQLQFSSSATCNWTPTAVGDYLLSITALDGATGAEENETFWYQISNGYYPVTAVSVTASPTSPQDPNTPITLTAAATGGTYVRYQFLIYNPNANPVWGQLQAYSSSATCCWTPTEGGNYFLIVSAKDEKDTVVSTSLNYAITGTTLTGVSFTSFSHESPYPNYNFSPITIHAMAKNGTNNLDTNVLYQFWVYNAVASPTWSQLQGYSATATCAWTPTAVGNYILSVTAKDTTSGSTANAMASYTIQSIEITIPTQFDMAAAFGAVQVVDYGFGNYTISPTLDSLMNPTSNLLLDTVSGTLVEDEGNGNYTITATDPLTTSSNNPRYVDAVYGNESNDGSEAHPWQRIYQHLNCLYNRQPVDALYLANGVYTDYTNRADNNCQLIGGWMNLNAPTPLPSTSPLATIIAVGFQGDPVTNVFSEAGSNHWKCSIPRAKNVWGVYDTSNNNGKSFHKYQYVISESLCDNTPYSWYADDASNGTIYVNTGTLTGNPTMDAPLNPSVGLQYSLVFCCPQSPQQNSFTGDQSLAKVESDWVLANGVTPTKNSTWMTFSPHVYVQQLFGISMVVDGATMLTQRFTKQVQNSVNGWAANTDYSLNDIIQSPRGGVYCCTGAGTSGATAPIWPTSDTVQDGSVLWTASMLPPWSWFLDPLHDVLYVNKGDDSFTPPGSETTFYTYALATGTGLSSAAKPHTAGNIQCIDQNLVYLGGLSITTQSGVVDPTYYSDHSVVPVWHANQQYAVGQLVQPTAILPNGNNANGYFYKCYTAGDSGATEPTWPTSPKAIDTVPDAPNTPSTLTWQVIYTGSAWLTYYGVNCSYVDTPASDGFEVKGRVRAYLRNCSATGNFLAGFNYYGYTFDSAYQDNPNIVTSNPRPGGNGKGWNYSPRVIEDHCAASNNNPAFVYNSGRTGNWYDDLAVGTYSHQYTCKVSVGFTASNVNDSLYGDVAAAKTYYIGCSAQRGVPPQQPNWNDDWMCYGQYTSVNDYWRGKFASSVSDVFPYAVNDLVYDLYSDANAGQTFKCIAPLPNGNTTIPSEDATHWVLVTNTPNVGATINYGIIRQSTGVIQANTPYTTYNASTSTPQSVVYSMNGNTYVCVIDYTSDFPLYLKPPENDLYTGQGSNGHWVQMDFVYYEVVNPEIYLYNCLSNDVSTYGLVALNAISTTPYQVVEPDTASNMTLNAVMNYCGDEPGNNSPINSWITGQILPYMPLN